MDKLIERFDELAKEIVICYKEKKENEELKKHIEEDDDRYEIVLGGD